MSTLAQKAYQYTTSPTRTYSWGYIPFDTAGRLITAQAMWFKTKRAADTYGAGRGPHILARALEIDSRGFPAY